MKVFQVANIYPAHLARLGPALSQCDSADAATAMILADVPQAQILAPCIGDNPDGQLCFPQHQDGLRLWAQSRGMPQDTSADDILLAQIEEHGADVFYSTNATRHSKIFLGRMPGCVRLKIGWLGSEIVGTGLHQFDVIVSNFPTLNANHAKAGLRTYYLTPSYETQTDVTGYVPWPERRCDLFFAGTYSRHHQKRARLIEDVSRTAANQSFSADFRLLNSRHTRLAETTPLGLFPPFSKVRRPLSVRRFAKPPTFGRDLFDLLGNARIVLNTAIDIAGRDRGNMRCFETLSAGALMISDEGHYPDGFVDGETHVTYRDTDGALARVQHYLNKPEKAANIARAGWDMIRQRYSKARQWQDFVTLVGSLGSVRGKSS